MKMGKETMFCDPSIEREVITQCIHTHIPSHMHEYRHTHLCFTTSYLLFQGSNETNVFSVEEAEYIYRGSTCALSSCPYLCGPGYNWILCRPLLSINREASEQVFPLD